MRDSLRRLYGVLVCFFLFSSPVWANFVGLDAVQDSTCGPEDMVLEFAAGDVGSFVNVPVYFDDMPNSISLNCVFCVKDKSMVTNEAFSANYPAGWSVTPFTNSDGAWSFNTSQFIIDRYPNHRCYAVQGVDFSGTNPVTVFPRVVGTFQFQVAQEGCLGFVIDGANSGFFSALGLTGVFTGPGEACDTASCPTTVEPVAIDDVTPSCPLASGFVDQPYTGPTFTATGGVPPYTWTQTGLPAGMDIGLNDGVVSGTPAQIGPFPFTVRVDDSDGGFATRACSLFVIGFDVQVTALSDLSQTVSPGDVVNHVFEVWNKSNVTASFQYDAGSTQGFTITPDAAGATLAENARDTVGVDETIPADPGCPAMGNQLFDQAYFGAGIVLNKSDALPSDADTVDVQVSIAGAATLTALDTLQCDYPLESVSFDLQVANDGACADTFDLSASALDLSWNYYVTGSLPLVIPGGQSQQIAFGVDIPEDAPCIDRQRFALAAVGRQFGSVSRDTVKACAAPVYEGVATGPGNGFGEPGDTVLYCFKVRNTGNCPTFYRIDFSAGWAIDPVDGATTLEPGDSATFCTNHIIPASAQSGDQDQLCGVVSLSAANPTKTLALPIDTLCVTTTVQVACQGGVLVEAWTNGICHDPDSTFEALFDVQNSGTCTEVFTLGAGVDGAGWETNLSMQTVEVEAGSTSVVPVLVTVASDALCAEFVDVWLTATGQTYGAADADTVQECANPIVDGTVTAPANQSGEPGEVLTYCFEIENTGNCTADFGIGFGGNWQHEPGFVARTLAPGDTAIVCETHVVPADAQPGDQDSLCCAILILEESIEVAKEAQDGYIDTACVVSTAIVPACEGGVDVIASGGPYMGTPGGTTPVSFYVKNTGSQDDQFAMNASASTGWTCSIQGPDTTAVLAVGDSALVMVDVGIPQNAGCDVVADIELVALSLCDPSAYDSATNPLGVYPVCDWDILAMTEDSTAAPGQTVLYAYRLTNTGNCTATPILSALGDPASWVLTLPAAPENVAAGDHVDLAFELEVPADALEGDEHKLEVCVFGCQQVGKEALLPPPPMACDSTITRVLPGGCEQGQPVLSLGGYTTLEYVHPNWVVQVQVKNAGPGAARNVNLDMNEDLEWLTIPDDHVFYGDLAQGSSSYGMPADGFTFDLTNYPGGSFNVWFDVTYEDTCGTPYQVRLDPTFLDPTENGVPSPVTGGFALHQNRPNPFNPTTTIFFDLPAAGQAELTIFNAAGQLVKRLWSGSLPQGTHTFTWSGETDRGTDVPSGTYFYSLKSGGRTETKRMVLVR